MPTKIISQFIIILIVVLLDIAFINRLPFGLHRVHFFPIILVFVYLLGNIRYSAWWVIIGGYLLELFTFGIYGFHFFGLLLSLCAIYFLFERVMTNRSLYSIAAVSGVSVLLYTTNFILEAYFSNHLSAISWQQYLTEQGIIIGYSMSIAVILFYIFNAVTKRLRPVFLAQRGYKI